MMGMIIGCMVQLLPCVVIESYDVAYSLVCSINSTSCQMFICVFY